MKRAIIFANGVLPDPVAIRALIRPDDWIIAADGGTGHALACGRSPHLVIGDLDSFPAGERAALEAAGTVFHTFPADKDKTDLELALLHVAAHGPASGVQQVLVVGALGGRLDQTLANLLLLARPELESLQVLVVDGRQTAQLVRDRLTLHGSAGDRVSLIPLGGDADGVQADGLRWPLDGERLRFGAARGLSNVMTGPVARIQLESGRLLCLHQEGPVED